MEYNYEVAKNGTVNDFRLNLKEAKPIEKRVLNWLISNGVECKPYSLKADKQGTDIACTWGTIDVKAEKQVFKTNNLTFETFSNILTSKLGWGWHDTDYIIWVDDNPVTKNKYSQPRMYIARLADLRQYYLRKKKNLRHVLNVPVRDRITKEIIQQSQIALIPLMDFVKVYPLLWVLPGGSIVNIGKVELGKPYAKQKAN